MARKKKEDNPEEIKKPKAISPFDIIKMMFTDKDAFDKLSNNLLSKNFFMINRIMAIQFPMQAECFNQLNINQAMVIRCWQQFAVSKLGYGRVPGFVYTKGAKATNSLMVDEVPKDVKEAYCLHYNISLKELDDMLYFAYDMTLNHINKFIKTTSSVEQNKNITKVK